MYSFSFDLVVSWGRPICQKDTPRRAAVGGGLGNLTPSSIWVYRNASASILVQTTQPRSFGRYPSERVTLCPTSS
jgi:hypothetical protein